MLISAWLVLLNSVALLDCSKNKCPHFLNMFSYLQAAFKRLCLPEDTMITALQRPASTDISQASDTGVSEANPVLPAAPEAAGTLPAAEPCRLDSEATRSSMDSAQSVNWMQVPSSVC